MCAPANSDRDRPTQLATARLAVRLQEFIDDRVEIHEPRVFPEVILRFAEPVVRDAVRSHNTDLSRLLEGPHDLDLVHKFCTNK